MFDVGEVKKGIRFPKFAILFSVKQTHMVPFRLQDWEFKTRTNDVHFRWQENLS